MLILLPNPFRYYNPIPPRLLSSLQMLPTHQYSKQTMNSDLSNCPSIKYPPNQPFLFIQQAIFYYS